jgi:hypothetical protein
MTKLPQNGKACSRGVASSRRERDSIDHHELSSLTEYVTASMKGDTTAIRAAQKEANRLAKKFGLPTNDEEPEWNLLTPWLQQEMNKGADRDEQRVSRVRVRAIMSMRAKFLGAYAVGGSQVYACRKAKVSERTINRHLRQDPDFRVQYDAAKAYAIEMLQAKVYQRCLEGDVEPVYWQGEIVGHIRKYPERLVIEMLRAYLPHIFKTPGCKHANVEACDKILEIEPELRAKLIACDELRYLKLKAEREAAQANVSDETSCR